MDALSWSRGGSRKQGVRAGVHHGGSESGPCRDGMMKIGMPSFDRACL